MKKTKNLFLALCITLVILFAGCVASILAVFLKDFDVEAANVLGLVFLFFHMLIIAVFFYLAFKAFWTGKSSLLGVFTVDDKGNVINGTRIASIIICALLMCMGIYMTLVVCGLQIPLSDFPKSLKFALMNVGYSLGIISIFFILYPITSRGN